MSKRSAERRFNSSLPVLTFCSELRKIAFRSVSSISTADKKYCSLYMFIKEKCNVYIHSQGKAVRDSLRLLA